MNYQAATNQSGGRSFETRMNVALMRLISWLRHAREQPSTRQEEHPEILASVVWGHGGAIGHGAAEVSFFGESAFPGLQRASWILVRHSGGPVLPPIGSHWVGLRLPGANYRGDLMHQVQTSLDREQAAPLRQLCESFSRSDPSGSAWRGDCWMAALRVVRFGTLVLDSNVEFDVPLTPPTNSDPLHSLACALIDVSVRTLELGLARDAGAPGFSVR